MKNIYVISVGDVQTVAKNQIGRKLTTNELKKAQKALDNQLGDWAGIVIDAIAEFPENDETRIFEVKPQ